MFRLQIYVEEIQSFGLNFFIIFLFFQLLGLTFFWKQLIFINPHLMQIILKISFKTFYSSHI